jgi:hypothetical protein
MSAKKQSRDGEAVDEPGTEEPTEDRQPDAAPQAEAQPKPDAAPKPEAPRKQEPPPKPDPKPQVKPKPKAEADAGSAAKSEKPKTMADIMKVDLRVRRPRRR